MNNIDRHKLWDFLQKQIIIKQLPDIKNKMILDFGAGDCFLETLLSDTNKFICIEPNANKFKFIYTKENIYKIKGDYKALVNLKDESMDVIFCHNVFEYLNDSEREKIIKEFTRILKKGGFLSFIKHNKIGRILEQIVFKNNFNDYKNVFIENESYSERFGPISYFKDKNIINWSSNKLAMINKFGLRIFYDLQSNMELQKDPK